MAKTLEPAPTGTGEIAFELERFEFKDADRVEVSGRWFGVRGRRFIRPTLTVTTDGRGSRALADLEHKPWAPEDGKLWQAAFSCELDGAQALEAELNVAPDITVALPIPASRAGTGKRARGAPSGREPAGRASARGEPSGREPSPRRELLERQPPPRPSARPSQESAARREIAGLKSAVEEAGAENERLRGQLQAAEAEQAKLTARVQELSTELDRAVAARKSAIAARDQALAAHERSAGERDAAVDAQSEAVAARDTALESRDAAIAMREEALNDRDESEAAQDAALLARDHAVAERNAARAAHDQAIAERETYAQTADRLRSQHDDDLSSRGAAMVMRNATISSGARHHAGWPQRLLAIIVVLAVIVALLVVVRVI